MTRGHRPSRRRPSRHRPMGLWLGAFLAGVLIGLIPISATAGTTAAELIMFEAETCPWCAAWDQDVGIIYDKTDEGRQAPLRRSDVDGPRPVDLWHIEGVVYTPTFVLLEHGREVGRIVGYPGEAFFWGLLGDLLRKTEAAAGS